MKPIPKMALACAALVSLATAGPGAAKPAAHPVPDRAATEAIIREYLLANPDIVLQAQQRAAEQARAKALAANRQTLETPFPGAFIGRADAPVTIVEFMDYGCHFCRETAPVLEHLLASDPGVRLVLRHYPILSELSAQAARVALLAAERGQFAAYHYALYAVDELTQQAIEAAGARAGLSVENIRAAAFDTSRDGEFARNEQLGAAIGATGTPTFVIGDTIVSGAMTAQAMAQAVAAARQSLAGADQ